MSASQILARLALAVALLAVEAGRAHADCDVSGTWTGTVPSAEIWSFREAPAGTVTGAAFSPTLDPAAVYFVTAGSHAGSTLALSILHQGITAPAQANLSGCNAMTVEIFGLSPFVLTRSAASYCGDATVDPGEECDDGNFTNTDTCTATCTAAICGDRVVETGEGCDDGNLAPADGCSNDCLVNHCGNGATEPGEGCDDANSVNGDGCSNSCAPNVCGNGLIESGEVCDDTNTTANDGCSATCQFEGCTLTGSWLGGGSRFNLRENVNGTILGDTYPVGSFTDPFSITSGSRTGNSATLVLNGQIPIAVTMTSCDTASFSAPVAGTFTVTKLSTSYCGDGTVDAGEGCDDSNFVNDDFCTVACTAAACGDRIIEPGELCDDGNTVPVDGCSATCQPNHCGNHVVESGEQCDDGNAIDGDGCSNACGANLCGNGLIESGEHCDDGGVLPGDGCTALCQSEGCDVTGFWQFGGSISGFMSLTENAGTIGGGFIDSFANTSYPIITGSRSGAAVSFTILFNSMPLPVQFTMTSCQTFSGAAAGLAMSGTRLRDAVCGDGATDPGERCDDGNLSPNDGCSMTCTLPQCGDGGPDPFEACDDGNGSNTDACTNDCRAATCGDAFVHAGAEACDDGNTSNEDACTNACAVNVCGDGFLLVGIEGCDDGNQFAADGCDATCNTEDIATAVIPPTGGFATTDSEADGATADDPIETLIQVPALGTSGVVAVAETSGESPATGYGLLGKQVRIDAPSATVAIPLVLVFDLDASIIPAGETAATIGVVRNGALAGECPAATSAVPDPCVAQRATLGDGDIRLTVLTSHASEWTLVARLPRPSASEAVCRKEVRKLTRNLLKARTAALEVCNDAVDRGDAPGPCPDAKASTVIAKAALKVDAAKLVKKCPDAIASALGGRRSCASVASVADLAACIRNEAGAVADAQISIEYGAAVAPLPAKVVQKCQAGIARAVGKVMSNKRLALLASCQDKLDAGKTTFCPDARTLATLAKAEDTARKAILKACSAATIAPLGAFQGVCAGAVTPTEIASCQIAGHLVLLEPITTLLP